MSCRAYRVIDEVAATNAKDIHIATSSTSSIQTLNLQCSPLHQGIYDKFKHFRELLGGEIHFLHKKVKIFTKRFGG